MIRSILLDNSNSGRMAILVQHNASTLNQTKQKNLYEQQKNVSYNPLSEAKIIFIFLLNTTSNIIKISICRMHMSCKQFVANLVVEYRLELTLKIQSNHQCVILC